jgi:hypothetical protein
MNERDFVFWLKGFLLGKEALDITDITYIEGRIGEIFRQKTKDAEYDLSEIIKKVSI